MPCMYKIILDISNITSEYQHIQQAQTSSPQGTARSSIPNSSHNHTAVLLQLLEEPRQLLLDKLSNLVVLLLLRLVMLRLVMLLLVTTVMPRVSTSMVGRQHWLTALEVDDDAADIILIGVIPQTELLAQLLDLGLDTLDAAARVVALADDGDQVRLAVGLVGADAVLEDAFGLLDELAVQVDRVGLDTPGGIVLAEDEVGGLLVVVVHAGGVCLALVGELLCGGAIAVFIGLAGL